MKIEIDLKDILQDDDYGSETIQESIRRQVTDKLVSQFSAGISEKIDTEIAKAIDEQIKKSLDEIRPNLINQILDAEYVSVDRYGDRAKEPTTFRRQLIKAVNENMVYRQTSYPSEKNPFTNAVDEILRLQVNEFKKQFDAIINANYVAETKAYAVKILKEKLGIV